MSKIENIKAHFKRNKKTYYAAAGGIVVGAATVIFLDKKKSDSALVNNVVAYKPRTEFNTAVINFVERSTPSKPVHLIGTERYFDSLSHASRETGIDLSKLSKHINHGVKLADDMAFEIVDTA